MRNSGRKGCGRPLRLCFRRRLCNNAAQFARLNLVRSGSVQFAVCNFRPAVLKLSRKPVFRLAAVCLGILPFVVFEAACRLTNAHTEVRLEDSWTEFAGTRPLFETNDEGDLTQIAADRRAYFAHDSFPTRKPAGQRRVFVLGGSTVQGRPFSLPTSFPTFLELTLGHATDHQDWDVINCGGISYASYRLRPVLAECLQHNPDLIIICTGHNEFLEFITYADVRSAPSSARAINRAASQLASVQFLRSAMLDVEQTGVLSTEVDAILDHADGLRAYHRHALHRADVVRKFGDYVQEMLRMCSRAEVPVLLVAPPSSLRDCPPFKSEFSAVTSDRVKQQIHSCLLSAQEPSNAQTVAALTLLERATSLDPAYAFSWYRLGLAQMQHKNFDAARASLRRACDEDVCPLRMTFALRTQMKQAAEDEGVTVLDLQDWLSGSARTGILGRDQLVDHVHPSFTVNQQIAVRLAEEMEQADLVSLPDGLHDIVAPEFQAHLQSLNNLYFLDGRRTLQVMKEWTQGRGDGPPLQSHQKTASQEGTAP